MNLKLFWLVLTILCKYTDATQGLLSNRIIELFNSIKCEFMECCTMPYVKLDMVKLDNDLGNYLFGQPMVVHTVINAFRGHYHLGNPSKALVLSFQGGTGTGKNFATRLIIESLFALGIDSKYVTFFVGSRDFPHNQNIDSYKDQIKHTIEKKLKSCPYSIFIFDEIDKIPLTLLDIVKSYIDVDPYALGFDPRKSVFIFISNLAFRQINQMLVDMGGKRDDLNLTVFRQLFENYLFKRRDSSDKGTWHSSIVSHYLIDHYIPFLPLEREHVEKCIQKEMHHNGIHTTDAAIVDSILEQIFDTDDVYAKNGCKRITNLVRKTIMEKDLNNKRHNDIEL